MNDTEVREIHYVVKYNMETKMWEIDWDTTEAQFDGNNYYDSRGGWAKLPHEFENPIIKELTQRLAE
jgi:hypothetical protein